jgi:hypothetical protein
MQISPETTPPMSSLPESCTNILTLTNDIEDAGETKELLDLKPKAIQTLPPRSQAPLSTPPLARTPEERGPVDRWKEE